MPCPAPHDLEAWTDCHPGTLSDLSRSLHRTRLRKTFGRVGAPLLVIVLVGFGVWSVNTSTTPSEFTFGGVCCSEVQSKLQQFMAGGLEQDDRRAIKAHLDRCPHCQEKMKAMQGNRVQIGIEAPSSIGVHRQEVWARLSSEASSLGDGEAEQSRAVA